MDERPHQRSPWTIAAWIIVFLVAYPLSIGPATWLLYHLSAGLSRRAVVWVVLYYPILWLADQNASFDDVLTRYLEFWNSLL